MRNSLVVLILGCLFIVNTESSIVKRRASADVGYGPNNGPSTWGGTCKTGKKQSPINIQLGKVMLKKFLPFTFDVNYLKTQKFYAKNNGHTVFVSLEEDVDKPTFEGGGLKDKFIFQQLHFHWESEHEFDGKRADLEMHIVHFNAKYPSFAEAVTQPDGIAVLAVIFDESEEQDDVVKGFFQNILSMAAAEDHPAHPVSPENKISLHSNTPSYVALRDLLPKNVTRFFRYSGSLTTPGCGEVVQWTVFIDRLTVSKKALDAFRMLRDHDGNLLSSNYRPPQKLNGRHVYIQMEDCNDDPGRNVASLKDMKLPSIIMAILTGKLLYSIK